MAFPSVVNTNESATTGANTAHTINLPASIVAGNLLLIILAKGSVAATVNAVAGWGELVDENSARGFAILYRLANGSEGSTLGLTLSGSTKSASIAYQISGASDPATRAPELSTVATGTSTSPNPTAVAVTGGPKDALIIATFNQTNEAADDDAWCTSAPANYTGLLQKTAGTAGTNVGVELATAHRQVNTSSEDPGAFTSTLNLAWRAYAISIHPAPPGGAGWMAARRRQHRTRVM